GAILALLYGRADQSFYTRQIAREVDASVGAVQRELENLSKVELIVRKSVGSQVFYQANRDTPIFPEMRALVNKTAGVFSVLRSALHPLSKQIVAAFVYGSLAREEESAQSDIDLMVVGNASLDQVLSRLSKVEKGIGRPINPTVYSVAEFKSKLATGNHFLTAMLELTVKVNPKLIQRFKTFNNKRNKSVYDVAGAVSDQELDAMVRLAIELKDDTLAWLKAFHPELLKT